MHPVWNTCSEHRTVTCTPQISRCKCVSQVSSAKVVPLSDCSLLWAIHFCARRFCSSFRTVAELLWLIQKESESSNYTDQCIDHFIVGCVGVFNKHVSIFFLYFFIFSGLLKNPTKSPQNTQQTPKTQNQLYLLLHFHWIASLSDTYRNVWWPFLMKLVWDK